MRQAGVTAQFGDDRVFQPEDQFALRLKSDFIEKQKTQARQTQTPSAM
jgi:hypothetical protein